MVSSTSSYSLSGASTSFSKFRVQNYQPAMSIELEKAKSRQKLPQGIPNQAYRATRRTRYREEPTCILSEEQLLEHLSRQRGTQFNLDAYVELVPYNAEGSHTEQAKNPGTESIFGLANYIRDRITTMTEYRWSQKKRRELANGGGTVVTYYCSQLEGEQSKHVQKTAKGPGWRFGIMQRYHCNGWLHVTVPPEIFSGLRQRVRVRISHEFVHPPPSKLDSRDQRGRFLSGPSVNMTSKDALQVGEAAEHMQQMDITASSTHRHSIVLGGRAASDAPPMTEAPKFPCCDHPEFIDTDATSPSRTPCDSPRSTEHITQHSSPSPKPDVIFPRDLLVNIAHDMDTIITKALSGVDGERAVQLNSLFLQLHQLGESIRAENRGATASNGDTLPRSLEG